MANTIDSGIDIGYFGGIDIDIGIDKRPLQLLVLILVLIRRLPELLAILFIKENTVITASRQRQPTFPSVLLLSLPASLSKTHHGHTELLIPFTKFDIGIDKTIDIDFFGSIDIGIDIDKRPSKLLILVLIRGLPKLLVLILSRIFGIGQL